MRREGFIRAIQKIAMQAQTNDGVVAGKQSDDVPALLQPDKGPGKVDRKEQESLSSAEETINSEEVPRYLRHCFMNFQRHKKLEQGNMKKLLDGFKRKDTVSARALMEKESALRLSAFSDELRHIVGV